MSAAKALARLRGCAGSSKPSLLVYSISAKITCARAITPSSRIRPRANSEDPYHTK